MGDLFVLSCASWQRCFLFSDCSVLLIFGAVVPRSLFRGRSVKYWLTFVVCIVLQRLVIA